MNFLANRKQRVFVNDVVTSFVNINRGVPQGTVLEPVLFSLMVNHITVADPKSNLMVKYKTFISRLFVLSHMYKAQQPFRIELQLV